MNSEIILYGIVVIVVVGIVVYFATNAKVMINENGLEINTKKNTETKVSDISDSEIDITKADGNNISVNNIKDKSSIKIK